MTHCRHTRDTVSLDKSKRDVFVTGTHADVQQDFQDLTTYCAGDVVATHNVLKQVTISWLGLFIWRLINKQNEINADFN